MKPTHSDHPVFASCPLNDWLENRKELNDSNVTKVKENPKGREDKTCPEGLRAEVSKRRRVNSKVRLLFSLALLVLISVVGIYTEANAGDLESAIRERTRI